jgi:hypothetical protein
MFVALVMFSSIVGAREPKEWLFAKKNRSKDRKKKLAKKIFTIKTKLIL